MRLRHKKPINSYAGQANHDANDARDEDFTRNYNSLRKSRNAKQKATNEQKKKLAQILYQFVITVNSDYRNFLNKNQQPQLQSYQNQLKRSKKIFSQAGKVQQNINGKYEEIVLKQQQKNQKAQKNFNKSLLTKKIKKQRQIHGEPIKSKENKQQANLSFSDPHLVNIMQKNQSHKKNIEQNTQKQKQKQSVTPQLQNTNIKSGLSPPQQIQQMQHLQQYQQQMIQNPLFAMNPALYSMFYPFPQMMTYQAYLQQIKSNPYMAMHNYMNMMSPNYIPLSKLPFNKNNHSEQKNQQKQKPKIQSLPIALQAQNNSKAQQKKQPTEKKNEIATSKTTQPIDFKNRSCYHVAIAYNIHFSKLKERGLLSNMNNYNTKQYQKLDPTFLARRIREKKIAEHMASIQQNSTHH